MTCQKNIFNEGEIHDLYLDQDNTIYAGKGLLLLCKGSNLPFILHEPIIYNTETWLVRIVESPIYPVDFEKFFNLRYIQSLTTIANNDIQLPPTNIIVDNFNLLPIDIEYWKRRVDESELKNDVF